ncbi:cold shock domain-containing protein E1-like [Ctenocephalides felis]|uniref:cold shock domain-containing protein E1-like n=1 Tax=Ctenocephalides felis TaxID=7515 RepID=UPI000E6E3FC6|nr:cold shock domain-containing protein E1-like [Ctenocephalides felis]
MYKEWIPDTRVDLCTFIGNKGQNGGKNSLSEAFLAKIRQPLIDILLGPGQKFPSSCPVQAVLSEERVTGNVTTELRTEGSGDTQGRISYENRGECFFLPYTKDDVEGNVTLRSGDKVSFQIATNQRGNLGACHVRLENPAHPVLYRGVVCSMKESFGFIERADVVKEIFFHFSEAKTSEELRPGDDVEFIILTRNGKEVACNIVRLPPGTVVFEDVDPDITKGQVLKPLDRGTGQRHQSDPLPGRIRYRAPDHSEVEVPFGDKDQKGDFTLRHGDWVQFQLATDRRDQLRRATSISLLDESFVVSGERRDQGVVVALKDGFGFLRCAEREPRLFFHFTEVLDVTREISMGDEVEFTAVQDPNSSFANFRHSAIRIKHLPPGTVKFETLIESNLTGVVTREASPRSPSKSQNGGPTQNGGPPVPEGGMISYQSNGQKKSVPFFAKDCDRQPRMGDKVDFNISQVKRNKELIATDVVVTAISNQSSNHSFNGSTVSSSSSSSTSQSSTSLRNGVSKNGRQSLSNGQLCQGFVAALKDGFGFIETISHDKEVFFHFSNFEGDTSNLDLGQEVEYILAPRGSNGGSGSGSCCSAENVRTIARGSIPLPEGTGPLLNGTVTRPLRSVNPDQNEYSGLIQVVSENGDKESYEFGITGLSNKRDLLQNGDPVTLRVDTEGRATEVTALRKKRRATVDAIKGLFGFLAYEVEEGKKLFFHMSEVEDGVQLQQGDTVEFALITNQRSGKSSACNVVKVTDIQARPERLISRLRVSSLEETGPRLTVSRQPKGPDGSKGFQSSARQPRQPGVIPE